MSGFSRMYKRSTVYRFIFCPRAPKWDKASVACWFGLRRLGRKRQHPSTKQPHTLATFWPGIDGPLH